MQLLSENNLKYVTRKKDKKQDNISTNMNRCILHRILKTETVDLLKR